jgi:hypothetical protein
MVKNILLVLLFLPFVVTAQYHISGRIVDSVTHKPVADASIFLSNASAGTKANTSGTFNLQNVRGGQYNLVISIIGYATYQQTVLVNKDLYLGDIAISLQSIQLQEVRIGPKRNWTRDYEKFKSVFLGNTDNAGECTIKNPHVLDFDYADGQFTATAVGFLIIENKALGYNIKYLLSTFTNNKKTGIAYYAGTAFFEDMKGSKWQIKRWKKNRLQTYLGSDMHFLRAVIADRVTEEGFKVERLVRKPNPEYVSGVNNQFIQTLYTTPLTTNQYKRLTNIKDEYALQFSDKLDVIYGGNPLSGTVINMQADYVYFDNNGIILNPQDVLMEGRWGDNRMGEMLPVDYEPNVN